jgi:hypothetical protein
VWIIPPTRGKGTAQNQRDGTGVERR